LGLKAYLVWEYSNTLAATNALLEVTVQPWVDPSDWNTQSVLSNFRGAWNNKGGALPFNLVFDSLSIHGFNERNSLYFPRLERSWDFNSLIDEVYSQRISISESPPGAGAFGNLWWNSDTGALAAWIPSTDGCSNWVEIDYRSTPDAFVYGDLVYADVATFTANILNIPVGTQVTILDITGLSIADNVIGVQGILASPGALTLYRSDSTTPYWTPVQFLYLNEPDFASDAQLLPYGIPVLLGDATSLAPQANSYSISNLDQQILGDYAVSLTKFYTNTNWTVSSDSLLRYIANSSLFSSPLQGEAWWDFAVPDPQLRAASIYYQSAWVSINTNPPTAVPAAPCNLSVINFYCDGNLLVPSVQYSSDDYIFSYTFDILGGKYDFVYIPKSLKGKTQFPTITISDNLTTVYQSDITAKVFSGVDYYMSPNVYDAETTLRVWKAQDLQVAETTNHLEEDNYINPLLADLNNGPGPENWERYFIRLPLDYGRDQVEWQKAVLTCQNFGYWGSTVDPEQMRCPPEDDLPAIYEELFLYNEPVPDYTYVYCEPYLYSNIAYAFSPEPGDYYNASVFPASDVQFDEFSEAQFIDYDAFHSRQANFSLPHGQGFGNWLGQYVNVNPCIPLTGFLETDLVQGGVAPVAPPVWDASIYKFAPTCENEKSSYSVDANHYKVGYAYFVADASAAEDGFFDIQQEAAWRDPEPQSQSLYLLPR
jgi:hypothetical protein